MIRNDENVRDEINQGDSHQEIWRDSFTQNKVNFMDLNISEMEVDQKSLSSLDARLATKKEIIFQVIEGRLPLLEAAARFAAVTTRSITPEKSADRRVDSNELAFSSRNFSRNLDDESICRTVIGWVHLALRDRPEQAEFVSNRLENELQTQLDRCGKIILTNKNI